MKKKKPAVSPEAAKILEQYRNAGKTLPAAEGGDVTAAPGTGSAQKPSAPVPPHNPTRQRSGVRGK